MRRSPKLWCLRPGVMLTLFVVAAGVSSRALAQDGNNPDVLRKELNDTLAQLKAAQDRKSELATENEKLKQQIAGMQKEVDETRRAQATWSEQTYALRARHAAWEVFLTRNPKLKAQWDVFMEAGPLIAPNDVPEIEQGHAATTTTAPATTHAATTATSTAPVTTMSSTSAPASVPASTSSPSTTSTVNEK